MQRRTTTRPRAAPAWRSTAGAMTWALALVTPTAAKLSACTPSARVSGKLPAGAAIISEPSTSLVGCEPSAMLRLFNTQPVHASRLSRSACQVQ